MTRRSWVYLEVPQRNAGLIDPHSLHIFYVRLSRINACKVIGVKIRRRSCQKSFLSPEVQIRIIWSAQSLALQSRQTKLAAKPLPLVFALRAARSNCLKRQATQAMDLFACSGDTEKVSLFGSMNLNRQTCRQSLR